MKLPSMKYVALTAGLAGVVALSATACNDYGGDRHVHVVHHHVVHHTVVHHHVVAPPKRRTVVVRRPVVRRPVVTRRR